MWNYETETQKKPCRLDMASRQGFPDVGLERPLFSLALGIGEQYHGSQLFKALSLTALKDSYQDLSVEMVKAMIDEAVRDVRTKILKTSSDKNRFNDLIFC